MGPSTNQTYNAAIDDAKAVLARVVEKTGDQRCFEMYISAVSALDGLKRRTWKRRKNTDVIEQTMMGEKP